MGGLIVAMLLTVVFLLAPYVTCFPFKSRAGAMRPPRLPQGR